LCTNFDIRKDWGGAPYNDLVNVVDWVEKNMPEVDMTRAVALGASYGGYMVNWLNGHDLGRKFKALVCHDGIFSFAGGLLATEELYFPFHVSQPLINNLSRGIVTNMFGIGSGWHTLVLCIQEPHCR